MAFLSAYSKIKIYTANATFKLPYDWNPQSNLIAALGAGANGALLLSGGGGAFAWSTNISSLVFQTVYTITIGTPAASDSSFASIVIAKGALTHLGGPASLSTGQNKFSGGNGASNVAGGGGGAAGPNGAGSNNSGLFGGAADGGTVSPSATLGANGLSGTEFDATHGCGTGGNAGAVQDGNGGNYGGGAASSGSNGVGPAGANGLVIVAYNPIGPSALFLGM